jgi:undecaprenyl-diphosphatase
MFKYIILGIVQGLTEFFPVSSSGHLVILQKILDVNKEVIALDIVLHLGTVCSLLIFFYKDILTAFRSKKTLILIFITTVITGIIAVAGKDFFAS